MADVSSADLRPIRVLISYAQESDAHRARVRKLADQLRDHGIDAMIDQYDSHPVEGWPEWMERQIKGSDFVVVVFTETYWRRANGLEQPGRGLGVAWEAELIRTEIFATPHQNARFIPVVFNNDDSQFVMDRLKSATRYVLDEQRLDLSSADSGYGLLYRHLTNQPLVVKPRLGRPIILDAINAPTGAASTHAVPAVSPQVTTVTHPAAPVSKGFVLVAEARSDVKTHADDFTRALREAGYQVVVPDAFSPKIDIRPSFDAALRNCLLIVQVLGEDPFPKTKLLDCPRYEQWIRQRALSANVPVLSWRPKALDLSAIVDDDYRALLEKGVVECDPEDFKPVLCGKLQELTTPARTSGCNLFVHHHTQDVDSADEVGGTAEDIARGLKVSLTDERTPPAESIGNAPVHGLMLIYGRCSEDWIEKSLDALKEATDAATLQYNLPPPARAIVKSRPDIPPLKRKPPRWKEISAGDTDALKAFVNQVQGQEVRS